MPVIKNAQRNNKSYLKEGLGQGEGRDYKPFIDVIHVSSRGRVTREKGWKTGRVHHFLTDSETRFFYWLEFMDSVIDIREHYPLIEGLNKLETTLDKDLQKRLINQKTGEPLILTTTFLITTRNSDGSISYQARSVKDSRQIEKPQAIERLEIQRRYWERLGIDFGLITSKDLPKQKVKNIEFLHSSYWLEDYGLSNGEDMEMLQTLHQELSRQPRSTIQQLVQQFDSYNQLEAGTGLFLYKNLLATKKLRVDMNQPIRFDRPIEETLIIEESEEIKDVSNQYSFRKNG